MSGTTTNGVAAALVPAAAPAQGTLTVNELAALQAEIENGHTLIGVNALGTRLLNQIASQVEQGAQSLAAIAGPFAGRSGALVTQGSLDAGTVDRFAAAATKVVQDLFKTQFDALQANLAGAQTELTAERTRVSDAQARIQNLEARASDFASQQLVAERMGALVAESSQLTRELAGLRRSARAIARHLCGEEIATEDSGTTDAVREIVHVLQAEIAATRERLERVEHEAKSARHEHAFRGAIEELRAGLEVRLVELETARLGVAEQAVEQHQRFEALREAHARSNEAIARLDTMLREAREAREIREAVAQMEARLAARLAELTGERDEHMRRAAHAAERALAIFGEHERMRERLAGYEARLAAIGDNAAAQFAALRSEQEQFVKRITRMGEELAAVGDATLRAVVAEAVESRMAEIAGARDAEALRAELSETVVALREELAHQRARLEHVAEAVSREAREREMRELLTHEREWVEERLAEHAAARTPRSGNPRR